MVRPFPSTCLLAGLLAGLVACSSGAGGPGDGGDDGASLYYSGTDGPSGVAADAGDGATGPVTYGPPYPGGQYALGPVDYAETKLHNVCAPASKYSAPVQSAEGLLLAGLPGGFALWGGIGTAAGFCDACIWVSTAKGKSALLRVVSYGVASGAVVDTSQSAFQLLDSGESSRAMTWQFAECPSTGPMILEFKPDASATSTSLWLRNARVPLANVEVLSENHPAWIPLKRESDGALSDANGFGMGPFQVRVTGVDGQQITDSFPWPAAGLGGAVLPWIDNFN